MISRSFTVIVASVLAAMLAALATAQQQPEQDLAGQIEELRKGQEAIQKELAEIKRLLQARTAAAAPDVAGRVIDVRGNPTKGEAGAPITLVEFSEYQCPYCSRYATQTFPQIAKEYIETGKVRSVFVDMPLESIHKSAFRAAEAARCAGEQGKYWEMHDRLFANQKALEPFAAHAEAIGLDGARFAQCMDASTFAKEIRDDISLASGLGATGTPTFIIARTDPSDPGRVTGITMLRGAKPFDAFKQAIDGALAEAPKAAAPASPTASR